MKSTILAILIGVNSTYAAKFTNQFIEFELPPQWSCNLEGAEWVCQSANEAKKKDAIIILAAKLKGDQDSIDQYTSYLKAAKVYTSVQGKSMKSEPKYTNNSNLNGQPWVDSLHLESEIPGFYTRYLATVKQDIGVLVTYTINKDKYQQYLQEFEGMVKTLKVFRKPGGINAAAANSNLFQSNVNIPNAVSENTVFQGSVPQEAEEKPTTKKEEDIPNWLVALVIGGIAYIIWKKKKG